MTRAKIYGQAARVSLCVSMFVFGYSAGSPADDGWLLLFGIALGLLEGVFDMKKKRAAGS